MHILPGNECRRSIASLAAATMFFGSLALPFPALAFSQLNPIRSQPKSAQQSNDKPVEEALEAPSKTIPMPDPLINNQAGQSSSTASSNAPNSGKPAKFSSISARCRSRCASCARRSSRRLPLVISSACVH